MNNTETGYKPQGAQPRDLTDFEQVIEGYDPIVVEWEDSVSFPLDGKMEQRYDDAPERKVIGEQVGYEKEKIIPKGCVYGYEDGREFKLPRKDGESDKAYQERFKDELGKELDTLAHPDNK